MTEKQIEIFSIVLCFLILMTGGDRCYGSSGFDFLRSDFGARPSSMGGAFVGVTGDLHGLMINPASLADIQEMEMTFSYVDHLMDIQSGFIGFGKSLYGSGRLGISIAYIHYGEFKRTDIVGTDLDSFTSYDYTFSLAYADSFPYGFRFGAAVKIIQSKIDQYTANGIAADFGIIYRIPSENMNIGLSVMNLGRATKTYVDIYERLPVSYRLGFSKVLAHLPLMLNFNFIKYPYDQSNLFWGLYWALGGEFTMTDFFFLRWGYHSRGAEEKVGTDRDWFAGISIGFGIRFRKYHLDYGFGGYGALGNKNYFTVTIPF